MDDATLLLMKEFSKRIEWEELTQYGNDEKIQPRAEEV